MMRSHTKVLLLLILAAFACISHAERSIRVLSIDGGGIRGLIPATVLAELEARLDKPISEIFDLVAGTSTGGLIALSLTLPDANKQPRYSADEVVALAAKNGHRIFSNSFSHRAKTVGGMFGPKYQSLGLGDVLKEILGDAKISQALTPTLVTGYYPEGEGGVEFFSTEALANPDEKDCLMREVAMATAAAPTFFDLANVKFTWGELSIADGGLYKMNPALLAYSNAKRLYPDRRIQVFSIGTGKISSDGREELRGRGMYQWLYDIVRHINTGNTDADHSILHKLLNEEREQNYFRLNIRIADEHKRMDDTSDKNINYLHMKGLELARSETFRQVVEQLSKRADGF